jgi:NADH:ubiquinone reductase (H+-translocating)
MGESSPEVVIVGGGFGGLSAARALKRAPVRVILIDRRNFHLFQPLLYQVATGGLSPANISAPLRALLRRQKNARVLMAEVVDVEPESRRLLLDGPHPLAPSPSSGEGERSAERQLAVPYDYLILAAGSRHHYFGNDKWEAIAPGLKTIEDALEIRRRLLFAFEMAERAGSPEAAETWLTFVVIGGGPTGVELAGAIGEVAHQTLRDDYREIDTRRARIVLVEALDRVLPTYPAGLSHRARASLAKLGVEVRTGVTVSAMDAESVVLSTVDAGSEKLRTKTVLWAAGVSTQPLVTKLAEVFGAEMDRAGRLRVGPDLSLPGRPEVFVIGDMALSLQDGKPLPGVAPVAMQEGRYLAGLIVDRLRSRPSKPFRYRDRGSMATIGRSTAVVQLGRLRLWGLPGWLTYLFVHLLNLEQFENRLLVLVQWGWNYFTRNRSARLITGSSRDGAE